MDPTTLVAERDGNALGGLFQNIITDLKAGTNNWDDLLLKANKFHIQLKSTISSSTAFLDAFQKIADMATTTRGGTKEIGSALTRLCLRNRSVEAKLKSMTSSLLDSFILPLQDRVDEWKKIIVQIDKEHSKEIKRLKQFRKKHLSTQSSHTTNDSRLSSTTSTSSTIHNTIHSNTLSLKSSKKHNHHHGRNCKSSNSNNSTNSNNCNFPRIGSVYDIDKITVFETENKEKYYMLEEVERNYVRRALIEERHHYCLFFNLLRPVIEEELSMLQEIIHLEEILTTLSQLTNDPHKLPISSENFLTNLQLNETTTAIQHDLNVKNYNDFDTSTINGISRKSSISSVDSFNTLSTDSISFKNCKSLSQPNILPGFRPKSIASQDSGFLSHDYNIPNIGRLIIHQRNRNGQNKEATAQNICLLNGKPVLFTLPSIHPKEQNNGIDLSVDTNSITSGGEYATSESLFLDKNNVTTQKLPVYANIHDPYQTMRGCYTEGSITPTNIIKSNESENENENYNQCFTEVPIKINPPNINKINKSVPLRKPKPPTPPMRHSSRLSSISTLPASTATEVATVAAAAAAAATARRSTLVFVKQKTDLKDNMEFPPPPPEAYMTIRPIDNNKASGLATLENENRDNICCRYSVPNIGTSNGHLVFCDNKDCLKDLIETSTSVVESSQNSYQSSYDHQNNHLWHQSSA